MKRFFSKGAALAAGCTIAGFSGIASAQSAGGGYMTDPETGIVYEKRVRSIEVPVTETRVEKRDQEVYRPQRVTETRPSTRTVFTPVVEHRWEPRVHNRWNPFVQPTLAYHHVPQTRWEARQETVQQTQTRTEWVAEKRTVEVPTQVTRMTRREEVAYQPVGRVGSPATDNRSALAARLRPLPAGTPVQSLASSTGGLPSSTASFSTSPSYQAPRIAASTVGRMTSDPPRRGISQGGLRAKELTPASSGVHGGVLPGGGSTQIAMPTLPFMR